MISEREKRLIKLGTTLLRKKLGKNASVEHIEAYLRTCSDKGFIEILDLIDFVSSNTKGLYQARLFKEYSHLCLFIAINHPVLKPCLEDMIKAFTKFENINIDIKPCLSKFDIYIINKIMDYTIKKFTEKHTYLAILTEAFSSSNRVSKYFMDNLEQILTSIEDDTIKRSMRTFLWLGVWMGTNDTAYRHQLYYTLNKLGNKKLKFLSTEFYFEPKDWYINIYTEAVASTREKWDSNEIPRHQNSLLEQPCVVPLQQQTIKKYTEKYGVNDYA
jgi:hypothetical protein